MPKSVPENGFYYHYKHNPNGDVSNYAYEVLGVCFHTEDDARPGEEHFVVYRPLYDAPVYTASKKLNTPCFDARPLTMWMGTVEKGGVQIPRFSRIVDPEILTKLMQVRNEMYPA